MRHNERIEIANQIAKKIVDKYGKNILLVGIFGSVRRNEDRKFSDLEMSVITRKPIKKYFNFVYKDITVFIEFYAIKDVIKKLKDVTPSWPLIVGKFVDPLVIYGSKKVIQEFNQIINSIDEDEFRKSVNNSLIDLVEHYNRVKNDYYDNDIVSMREGSNWFAYSVHLTLALLNRKYYLRNGIRRIYEANNFKKIPKNYFKLIKTVLEGKNVNNIFNSVKQLYEGMLELLKKNKIRPIIENDISKFQV